MKKSRDRKALELKLHKLRELTKQQLGDVAGGFPIGSDACNTGTGCGCTNTGPGAC